MGCGVGVEDCEAQVPQVLRQGGFAHGDGASKAYAQGSHAGCGLVRVGIFVDGDGKDGPKTVLRRERNQG